MKSFDVVALGELLIDFTEAGQSPQGNPLWEANPGGAPCNVLAMLQKLGRRTAFIGKVGRDVYGRQLRQTVSETGIDLRGLLEDPQIPTTLAVVHRLPDGDRDFSFYRSPGADMMLREEELDRNLLRDCEIFHFGTLSMTHEGVRNATKTAVLTAKTGGALISFDPNLRPPLWTSMEDARAQTVWGLSQCDVLKISDEELAFLFPEAVWGPEGRRAEGAAPDYPAGARKLLQEFPNVRMMNVTCGPGGSYCFCCGHELFTPAFLLGGTVDTTGAGDTFCACVLHDVREQGLKGRSPEGLRRMLRFANAAAYLVTTRQGALRSMPSPAEVEAILSDN